MMLLKTFRKRHYTNILNLQNPKSSDILLISSVSRRLFSLSAQFAAKPVKTNQKPTKPLSLLFKSATYDSERTNNGRVEAKNSETAKLLEKSRNSEKGEGSVSKERGQNGKTPSPPSVKSDLNEQIAPRVKLSAVFTNTAIEKVKSLKPIDIIHEDPLVYKELSSDMKMLANHLYMEGYFKDANFMTKHKFDPTCFQTSYPREYFKFAAMKFGEDHQEIAKWVSASDLKKVALFGCPARGQRTAYAAKHMRRFFEIGEREVCKECTLKKSCTVAKKKGKTCTELDLGKVMRVLVMYAMETVPVELVVPEEINTSVSRLLKEIVNLSQTSSEASPNTLGNLWG